MVYVWGVAGMVFVALELVAPGAYLYWAGMGCFGAAIAAALHGGLVVQLATFASVTFLSGLTAERYLRVFFARAREGDFSAGSPDAAVGQQAIVVEGIDNVNERGAVQIGDRIWEARALHGEIIPPESVVVIRQVRGARVIVEVA